MGLKKNFFKGLQNGLSTSPIKQENGVDKKFPNIVNEVANDNIVNNNELKFPKSVFNIKENFTDLMANLKNKANAKEIVFRNDINTRYNEARINKVLEQNPNIDEAALKEYMFSGKKGLDPSAFVMPEGGYRSVDELAINNRIFPSDAITMEDGDALFENHRDKTTFDIHSLMTDTNMMSMDLDEKKQYLNNKIENLELDSKNKGDMYEKQSKQNFVNWYTDPITQERLLQQAQGAGNMRPEELGGNVAGSLFSQGGIDGILSNAVDAGFNFKKMGSKGFEAKLGDVDPAQSWYDKGLTFAVDGQVTQDIIDDREYKYEAGLLTDDEIEDRNRLYKPLERLTRDEQKNLGVNKFGFGKAGGFSAININEKNLNVTPPGEGQSFKNKRDFTDERTELKRTRQQTGFHELNHYTGLDKAMDPALRAVLQRLDQNVGTSIGNREKYNAMEPGEMYANFSEFRKMIGMKPGEQFTRDSLQKVLEKNELTDDDFVKNFDRESLVKALNTIAKVDKKTPGKNKFEDLKMMQSDMNTEVA